MGATLCCNVIGDNHPLYIVRVELKVSPLQASDYFLSIRGRVQVRGACGPFLSANPGLNPECNGLDRQAI